MEWLEAASIPAACRNCQEADCYECDLAGERWFLSEEAALQNRRKMLLRSIHRLQQKVAAIDEQLIRLKKPSSGDP